MPAPLLATEVEMRVTGMVVRGMVRQQFANPSGDWAEGVYVFPLPEDAAVDHLRMQVGDRIARTSASCNG
jgi:Ca-activated chloride channel family protein